MLRFYDIGLENESDIIINDKSFLMDSNIWQNCRSLLRNFYQKKEHIIDLISIKNADGELVSYGYQDDEANRELRMLKELRENKQALQFTDIFPKYKEVIIWGCNELAFFFAEYLKEQGIVVSVIGQYWNYFGYETCEQKNSLGGAALIVYAEGIPLQANNLHETVIRSASPEFECIDKIYEANVLDGRICDAIGNFDEFIVKLKEESEIVILGTDRKAQDTYDLLMAYEIDICCFAVQNNRGETIQLGRKIMSIEDAMRNYERPVFLNYTDVHGALGEEWTEYFDYRGYERNKQYFLVRDYADIPTSNLIHVLHGKKVWLTGDPRLCRLLSDYLNLVENGEVTVQYTELSERITTEEDDILCLVAPDYQKDNAALGNRGAGCSDMWRKNLSDMGFIGHTEYFVSSRCFALIDLYLNKDAEKYTVTELLPKGILIGRIPAQSGNVFFRGIMDGHPEVLLSNLYSDFYNNMFYYCIRLANITSDKVIPLFWEMYDAESGCRDARSFPFPKIFEERVKSLLNLKESFTSQELFVLFHIAYIEMTSNRHITEISKLIIYWEPHLIDRDEFPFYALWLEDEKVNGNTILLCRDNMIRAGSAYNWHYSYYRENNFPAILRYQIMFLSESIGDTESVEYRHWTEHKMRFEDIKTKPVAKLTEICEILDIAWSDSMLQTTNGGQPMSFVGSIDFDLKPVFNKHEDYFSEFDRFRISIACSPYQKRYGYTYDNCLKFTRREIQEMFLKAFLFDEKAIFGELEKDIALYEWMRWKLWNVRKHMVLVDENPEFDRFELDQTGKKRMDEYNQKEIDKSMDYIKNHNKLILYGTGCDCLGLLMLLDESTKERLLYSDKKAETKTYIFQNKNVIAPKELRSVYEGYDILVTSSLYRLNIEYEFKNLGIEPTRVYYNRAQFHDENK